MKFGMINVFNVSIVVLLLLPNLIYAVKQRGQRNLCENRLMNLLEQDFVVCLLDCMGCVLPHDGSTRLCKK